ncbi:glycerol-3-phosphate dehydrogenase/oxidase [Devosia sp. XJ19-1]|uniref:Glycerol-3-phosphate dehydrogenase/oxidase n=1 Tax=Devosia ureilytica TaxID=2952754 RepID=A0A9Q4FRQ4_9HYPH|nr:glycerol-3-phosphate dehydrogenase/oxidase [Devosia ureilytica]MCP8883199.1 glycerol-3-phosphate dehydrogenase/oxidase [Devosia ureilytica]MCP8886433.1 glycerol-3-phosphate dehydrogenase/oxidase [Devosia ureilytica]
MTRQSTIEQIKARPDPAVLVIGGGINGISVFRELALNGVDVVLAEKADYCSGASSALSRMVHGGLRYLENGEFKLVRESLLERDLLLANAPHYVRPLPTTVPIFGVFSGLTSGALRFLRLSRRQGRRGAVLIKLGLSLYDLFTAGRRALPRHAFHGRSRTKKLFPALNPGARASATYYDAWVSRPERLALEMLAEGVAAGGLALNHASVCSDGSGLVLNNALEGDQFSVRPRLVINATGGWIDLTNAAIAVKAPRLIGGTMGSHLIVDNAALYRALDGQMIYYENEDGRICVVFPYLGKVLVGSTDERIDDPDAAIASPAEQDYILASLSVIFPSIIIAPEEIVFRFAGVRPLPASAAAVTGRIPRDHFCEVIEGDPPVLCMIGGKWTTFRSFGALAADTAMERLCVSRTVDTKDLPIGGGRNYPKDPARWVTNLAAATGVSEKRAATLLERYGTSAADLAQVFGDAADIAGHSVAELNHLIAHEQVETLADLLLRRTTIAITGALSLSIIGRSLDLLATAKGWTEERRAIELQNLLDLLATRHGLSAQTLARRDQRTPA